MRNTALIEDSATGEWEDANVLFIQSAANSSVMFNENILPKEKIALLNALDYLARLKDDWNGYSALAPSQSSIDMARHFITLLPLNRAHAGRIEPDGDEAVILTWQNPTDRIMLTIDGNMAHLSHERSGHDTVYINDIPFFNEEDNILPHQIIDRIPTVV